MKTRERISSPRQAELVQRLRRGDPAAMEELYHLYRDRLLSLILEQVGRDHNVAEDLLQEIFLAALSSIGKFRGDSQFYTWLCSIAFHKITDFYRVQARELKPEKSSSSNQAKDIQDAEDKQPTTTSLMESEETRQLVQRALVDLPPAYREVLLLKYVEDRPVTEISQLMGRSPKSVEGLLSRARKALRTSLEGNGQKKVVSKRA